MDAVRAYQVRFRPETLKNTHNLDENDKFFLMDENTSYLLLYDIARIFGYCSHVAAEGLRGTENRADRAQLDTYIWEHAIKHGYKAVLTVDSDFIDIATYKRHELIRKYGDVSKSPDHVPVLIRLDPKMRRDEIMYALQKHEQDIRDFISDNNHSYGVLKKGGLIPVDHDRVIKRAIKKANDNKPQP